MRSAINETIKMPKNMGTAINVNSVAIYSLVIQKIPNKIASINKISLKYFKRLWLFNLYSINIWRNLMVITILQGFRQ